MCGDAGLAREALEEMMDGRFPNEDFGLAEVWFEKEFEPRMDAGSQEIAAFHELTERVMDGRWT